MNKDDLDKVDDLIGHELKQHRVASNLTRPETVRLATETFGTGTLTSYETGIRPMTLKRYLDICNAIGASAPELITRVLRQIGQDRCPTCQQPTRGHSQ